MAKWLNKYFSLGSNKTKSPPQPPWPDYREKCSGAGSAPCPDGPPHLHHHTSPDFPHHCLCDNTSDLLCAYRAQKDLDFEDPYSGPGSSLCKLRTMCHPDYSMPEHLGKAVSRAFSSSSCCTVAPATCTASSPHLFRSHNERCPVMPPDMKYIFPKHRFIKINTVGGSDGASKKLNKESRQLATSVPSAVKDKVLIADDYSDPFDAKSELNRMGKGENTGYMEPYEAQRIMTAPVLSPQERLISGGR